MSSGLYLGCNLKNSKQKEWAGEMSKLEKVFTMQAQGPKFRSENPPRGRLHSNKVEGGSTPELSPDPYTNVARMCPHSHIYANHSVTCINIRHTK